MKNRAIVLGGLVALSAICACADDWPQWRGPNRDGISKETGLLKEWPKSGPKLAWQLKDIGNGYATPSVVGERIYVLGNEGNAKEFVQVLDVKDGKRIWTTQLGKVGAPDQQPNLPQPARRRPLMALFCTRSVRMATWRVSNAQTARFAGTKICKLILAVKLGIGPMPNRPGRWRPRRVHAGRQRRHHGGPPQKDR